MVPLLLIITLFVQALAQDLPSCDSKIYCQGDLLHTIQMNRPFNDSKTFVDLSLVNDETKTLENFNKLMQETNNSPSKDDVKKFVSENFAEGLELEAWTPSDWVEEPALLGRIVDDDHRNFAKQLVAIWLNLARKIKQGVIDNPSQYSILPVDHGFIIPGGRFKEFYYWDSYWIVRGLLLSDMSNTVRGMLDNFLSIVEKYGFVPNGARVYYLNRSQPPLLTLMASRYVEATNDTDWLETNIATLEKELEFWLTNKIVTVEKNGVQYQLAHYDSKSGSPRPESYYEDYNTASHLSNETDRKQLFADLKSGAESGWDFSSRWIIDKNGSTNANLSALQTRRIIPVDLNSFLCQAFRKLAELHMKVKKYKKATIWIEKANSWVEAIKQVHYNEDDGIWYDYDSVLGQHRKDFYPSNFAPLWSDAYDLQDAEQLGRRAAEYFENQGIMEYQGGIPASISKTGEQWDYPNAWPPLQSIVILGLYQSGNCKAKEIARTFADRWVTANMIGFNNTGEMFEKYDAENPGGYGAGGEYVVQSGFGWTNGVVFEFLDKFFTTDSRKRA